MRKALGFSLEERRQSSSWNEALNLFRKNIDSSGITVMISGIVGSNTRRTLNVDEFRGFALCDDLAPIIFINGADSQSAQMFTLAHELAHIWLGKSALSNDPLSSTNPSNNIEVWCNKVAAEFLVPLSNIKNDRLKQPLDSVPELSKKYKVSTLVIIRRLLDAQHINRNEFDDAYTKEMKKIYKSSLKKSGGNFYKNIISRNGNKFVRELIESTWEGHTSFTEALHLLGIKKMTTFKKISKSNRSF